MLAYTPQCAYTQGKMVEVVDGVSVRRYRYLLSQNGTELGQGERGQEREKGEAEEVRGGSEQGERGGGRRKEIRPV